MQVGNDSRRRRRRLEKSRVPPPTGRTSRTVENLLSDALLPGSGGGRSPEHAVSISPAQQQSSLFIYIVIQYKYWVVPPELKAPDITSRCDVFLSETGDLSNHHCSLLFLPVV